MKPPPFEYHRPTDLEEALALLGEHGDDAKILAGGQSLIPTMNFRLAQPEVLIDLNGVEALFHIEWENGGLQIGAMTRQRAVEASAEVSDRTPLLTETLPFVAHPQIRNRGTIGGSLVHADPAAELPAVMVVHRAQFMVKGPRGERAIAAEDFYTGLFETALEPDELLVDISVPVLADGVGWAFDEVARRHGDYGLVGVAAAVALDDDGRCRDVRAALLSVGEGPVLAESARASLEGEPPTLDAIRAAAEATATQDIDPAGDIHATADYRRHLAGVLLMRVLTRAVDRARTVS